MLKDLLRACFIFIIALACGCFVKLCQNITDNMTDYLYLISLSGMLIFLWVYIIKTIQNNIK